MEKEKKKKEYVKPESLPIGSDEQDTPLMGSVESNVGIYGGDRDDDGTHEPAAKDNDDVAPQHSVWD